MFHLTMKSWEQLLLVCLEKQYQKQ
uniref:Peptidyl-prolyl cis-trans isomerase n=1 Tax=Dolomedes sulfureus TaxID=492288 RepID=A0A0P0DQH7_9ARAC|nr:peptidyl-prolyl cis-trans isomerase [Dolomedes sulfureus]